MAPSFYSSSCPVFCVSWLGNRSQEETEAYVLYSGGGGSTKSGVKNQICVASLKPSETSFPTFNEVCSVETEDRICSTFHVDQPRENGKAQLIAMGLGNMLMIYGVTSTHELVPMSSGAEFKGKKEGSLSDVKCIAFESHSGRIIASGDEDGVIRLIRLQGVDKSLKSLAKLKSPKEVDSLPKITFDQKVVELGTHQDAVLSLQFSSTGKMLCSASKDGTCRIWHVESGRELCVIQATANMPPAYTKDKRVLKQMCRVACFSLDEQSVYTLQSAARGSSHVSKYGITLSKDEKSIEPSAKPMVMEVANCPVTSLVLSPCERFLVIGDTKGVVSVFDAKSLKKVKSYEGHQLPVSSLCLSNPPPESKLATCGILTGSGDKTIIIGSTNKEASSSNLFKTLLFWSILFLIIAWVVQNAKEEIPFLDKLVSDVLAAVEKFKN